MLLLLNKCAPNTVRGTAAMQVCFLDLNSITSSRTPSFSLGSARSRPTPSWTIVQAHGMTPSARTSGAAAVLGDQLLLHGGMLVSKSVAGRLSQDTFCLNFSTWTWTRMAASQERAVGSTSINVARASHMAVAVPAAAAVMLIGRYNDTASKAIGALTDSTCLAASICTTYMYSILQLMQGAHAPLLYLHS